MDMTKDKFNLLDVDGTDIADICRELHDRFKRGQSQVGGTILFAFNKYLLHSHLTPVSIRLQSCI